MIAVVRRTPLHHSILDTLSYAAVFGAGVTRDQLQSQLHTNKIWSSQGISQAIRELVSEKKVLKKGPWIVIPGLVFSRDELSKRQRSSTSKVALAKHRIGWFSWLPTIQAIALTGSVAAGSAFADDDIDLMIVTYPGTLWITRLVVLGLLLPTGWLRRSQEHGDFKDLLCLNLWLTTESLSMQQHTLYIAHEVMQAMFLVDRGQIEYQLLLSNRWVKRFLATGYAQRVSNHDDQVSAGNSFYARFASLFSWCDRLAFTLQRWHMKGKQSREVVTREKAFFHPRDTNKEIMQSYSKKRQAR